MFENIRTVEFEDKSIIAIVIGGLIVKEGRLVISAAVTRATADGVRVDKVEVEPEPWMLGNNLKEGRRYG